MMPEDLLRFVFVGDPQMSPDGQRVLFVRKHVGEKNKYITNLWVADVAGGEPVQFTSGRKDRSPRWSPDGAQIAFLRSDEESGKTQVFLMSSAGGEARALTKFTEGSIGELQWSPDGRALAVSFRESDPDWTKEAEKERKESGASEPPRVLDDIWYRMDGDGYFNGQRHALYIVDVESGEHRLLFKKDTLGHFDFDFTPDSKSIVVSANPAKNALLKPWNANFYIVNVRSGKAREVKGLPKGPKASIRVSPDGTQVAYAGREGDDSEYSTENLRLFVADIQTGKARDLTGGEDYCLMSITLSDSAEASFAPTVRWHPDGKRIFTRIGWHGEGRIASVSAGGGKMQFHTRGSFDYAVGEFSRDGKRLALVRGSMTELPEVGVAEVAKGGIRTKMLTNFNRDLLKEIEIAKPESHWIESTDGVKVQVWVMKPPTAAAKGKMPAILEIHGGPHAQYGTTFFHEFQVLAGAGYAVFYSNPRGSKGYGRDFCNAIRGSWGGKDWEDIQSVIRFMKSQPWVDTSKMGVMGGSYGGYMTNWVIGHTREFAAAITDRCVSNLVSMWGNSDFPGRPDKYWPGNAWDKPEALWQSSPIRLMGNARTPTLIIHSEGDLRCNIEQAEQVFTVLRTHNVPSRFVRYPRSTSHGMSRMGPPDLRLHRLHQILDWWKKYLG